MRQPSKGASFKGLDALVQCFQRYVAANPSRFGIREEIAATHRVLTVVLNSEKIQNEDRILRPI